jgi:23S rRNA (uridine2552-2'-O)-methyltransferase
MKKSKSSRAWLKEHHTDPYVQQAQQAGYRSRAAFKLLEIQKKDKLIQPGMTVVDLGAAPGAWSVIVADLVGKQGRCIALDILPMEPIPDVQFIQGDLNDEAVLKQLYQLINNTPVDLVISDIAPNMSGISAVDQLKSMALVELVLEFACSVLKSGGNLLIKVFQGAGFEELMKGLRSNFSSVAARKPHASRSRSSEVYLLAKGFKGIIDFSPGK